MKHSKKFVELVEDVKPHINQISAQDVYTLLQSGSPFKLIDVRESNEWDMGHLPNAIHLSKGIIERDIENFVKDSSEKLVLYCGGGSRSALAAENLQKMGYQNVYSMEGGFRGWFSLDYPIVNK